MKEDFKLSRRDFIKKFRVGNFGRFEYGRRARFADGLLVAEEKK